MDGHLCLPCLDTVKLIHIVQLQLDNGLNFYGLETHLQSMNWNCKKKKKKKLSRPLVSYLVLDAKSVPHNFG